MNEVKSRWLTDEIALEQLLRDSADCDPFGTPPKDLVQRALASFATPCSERSIIKQNGRATALIVLSLAAAGLFLTALTGISRWGNRRAPTVTASLTTSDSNTSIQPSIQVDRSAGKYTASLELPPSQFEIRQVAETSSSSHVRTVRFRRHRANARIHFAPKAIWTTSVVSASEEGIILPVVAACSDAENPAVSQSQPAVAVVPLQSSGLTYTEYRGDGGQ